MTIYDWPLMKNTITFGDRMSLIWFIATSEKFTNGPQVRKFEQSWNEWLGSKHSLYVSSGSTANTLLMSAIKEKNGLKDGDKVIVPACTWVTNVAPVFQCGLIPIFCDVNLSNYSFDTYHLKKIAAKHKDIKAIFITHLLGFSADNEAYKEIFPKAIIIEDVCESHGCLAPDGKRRGSTGNGATFSFYFGHHMTTIEGGMVSTDDEDLHDLMRIKRSHGMARELPHQKFDDAINRWPSIDPRFMFLTDGYNFRNTELGAVLGMSQLKRLDTMIVKRRQNYSRFLALMSVYEDEFHIPTSDDNNSSYAFPLVAKDGKLADKVKVELEKCKIESRPIVSGNLLMQPFLSNYSLEPGSKINVQILHDNGVYIGNNHFVDEVEMDMLAHVLKNVTR